MWSVCDRWNISGGIGVNVVPELMEVEIDIPVRTMEDFGRMMTKMKEVTPFHPEIRLHMKGYMNRPPMERTDAIGSLYHLAQLVAHEELDLHLEETGTGGVSDGNFIAACGTPTLDGLGARGDGAHAVHEHVRVEEMQRRAVLLAGIMERL
ncbi:M20/M25/M40 family metallo-hydrolase [Paenibacillus sp. ACRRX]|uniref:M20/M25/M40 family metallo-hydrolase n=1 Tax=Paenibacillus sp. ACRRX TaxID=2918206 RepID=UPI001EF57722|nr:M20/M25/M40 family metallo-hydrolase [Paenibacillus sp. ACRRX]MCG7410276.1 M20/M25/M40 family metallo-hydrolase [Paenibacillus sp. ACRRX]